MTPQQTELARRICTPIQRKVMMMREKYVVEEVAKSLDKTTAEIDQIEAAGWLKLGSYDPPPMDEFMGGPAQRRRGTLTKTRQHENEAAPNCVTRSSDF